jgi:glucose-6-phosphate-specific signal transduction histidine kinase
MSETVIIALIGFLGSMLGTLGGIALNTKLSNYRIEQLEKKVDKHNHLIERMYSVEEDIRLLDEKVKVANHRIDDLEKKG